MTQNLTGRSVLFLLEGRTVPASRFRVEQFLPRLRGAGVAVRLAYSVPNKYLWCPRLVRRLGLRVPWSVLLLLIQILGRMWQIAWYAPQSDVIVLQRDLLFRVRPPFLERFLFWCVRRRRAQKKVRIVFDVDDAIFLDRHGAREEAADRKYREICSACDLVIAGNRYLERYFSSYAPCVVVPTVVDTETFCPVVRRVEGPLVIGWIGVASNLPYLVPLSAVLSRLQSELGVRIVIVTDRGATSPFVGAVDVELIAWSAEREVQQIQRFDIGIMPLPHDAWAEGKCGFKLLQYMACGIPAVASPVGVNREIVLAGGTGDLAATAAEWEAALRRLIGSEQLRNRYSVAARGRVKSEYSVQRWSEEWISHVMGLSS